MSSPFSTRSSLWYHVLFLAFVLQLNGICHAFVPLQQQNHLSHYIHRNRRSEQFALFLKRDQEDDKHQMLSSKRRLFLASALVISTQKSAIAIAKQQEEDMKEPSKPPNFDALKDLPPITPGCVRLFLCRHGQTENNRLRKVQGARVDPPINENGMAQAMNLGKALAKITPPAVPQLFFSSKLLRAQMTAQIAASQIPKTNAAAGDKDFHVQQIAALSEVDFGPVAEGKPVALARVGMEATYAAWATGNIDYRPQGGEGESGRDVIKRVIDSIQELTDATKKSGNDVCVAVTHSTFLRILLGVLLDVPLLEAATYSVVNGGVSVIDVPQNLSNTKKLDAKSKLFSGKSPKDFDLNIPVCHVIRINETRHLPTIPLYK